MFCFFFRKSLHFTHSLIFRGREKKNTLFTDALNFCRKVVKNELFQGNKKISYLFHIIKQFFQIMKHLERIFFSNSVFDANFYEAYTDVSWSDYTLVFCAHYEAHSKDLFFTLECCKIKKVHIFSPRDDFCID